MLMLLLLGVFVSGDVSKGDVVCFYPGTYYPPPPLYALGVADGSYCQTANIVRHMWEHNVYCINLNDMGGYIDGFLEKEKSKFASLSPYAVGQKINHPDKHNSPNVSTFEFLWRDVFASREGCDELCLEEFLSHVPVKMGEGPWFIDPSTQEVVTIENAPTNPALPGLALVALEDLEDGRELFLDYELKPEDMPDWYHVPETKKELSSIILLTNE
jgi:hypothetical protein